MLNPALTIGQQVTEPLLVHLRLRPARRGRARRNLLAEMGIARPAQVMHCYPHQLSGGMKQRVGIATALASEPDLLLLDEPTTALDVTVEAQILDLLDRLRDRRGLSMLLVSHNLAIVDRLCDRVAVLYAGRVAETGAAAPVFDRPRHPYTKGLLAALPRPDISRACRLSPIAGGLPDLTVTGDGMLISGRAVPLPTTGCEQPQASVRGPSSGTVSPVGVVGDLPWSVAVQAPRPLQLVPAGGPCRHGRCSVPAACGAAFRPAGRFVAPSRARILACWQWTMCRYQ